MKMFLVGIFFCVLAVSTICFSISYHLNMPIVYSSWSKNECVKVEDPENIYTCENLPKAYIHYWVE